MALNLLDGARALFSNDLKKLAANRFNEKEQTIDRGLDAAIPTLLAGLIARTELKNGGRSALDFVNDSSNYYGKYTPAEVAEDNNLLERGWDKVKDLFGSHSDNVLGRLTSYAGTKVSTMTSLLGLAAPMIFTWLGNYAHDKKLNADDFATELQANKDAVRSALPDKLNMDPVFDGVDPVNRPLAEHTVYAEQEPERRRRGGGGLFIALLIILGLAALAWYYFTNEDQDTTEEVTVTEAVTDTTYADPTAPGRVDTTTGNYVYSTGNSGEIRLPDSTIITAGNNSTEQKLYNFLNDNSMQVDTADKTQGWITMDRVYFETNTSNLTAESQKQLDNVAAILKAFPNATIKVGGYTDNTGDSMRNVTLSADRARTAMNEIMREGIASNRLQSEGYGPMHPVVDNNTSEGKARNRRVDIRVTKK